MPTGTGSSPDILSRIKKLIPSFWFGFVAPNRDAVLGGLSDLSAWCYSLIIYARKQSRLATASDFWLDVLCYDFLGRALLRKTASDDVFRKLIQATILQERVTRAGMTRALTGLTNSQPTIFEPWNTLDTGAYGVPASGLYYGNGGGWGSMQLPGQVFMHVVPGVGVPISNVGGYGDFVDGYGKGSIEYSSPAQIAGALDTAQILQIIVATKATGGIVWVQFNAPPSFQSLTGVVETFAL